MTKSVSECTSGELNVEAIDANINKSPYFAKILTYGARSQTD